MALTQDDIAKLEGYMQAILALESAAFSVNADGDLILNGRALLRIPDQTLANDFLTSILASVGPAIATAISGLKALAEPIVTNA